MSHDLAEAKYVAGKCKINSLCNAVTSRQIYGRKERKKKKWNQ